MKNNNYLNIFMIYNAYVILLNLNNQISKRDKYSKYEYIESEYKSRFNVQVKTNIGQNVYILGDI